MTLSYEPTSDGYRTAVKGTVAGVGPGAALLVDLPTTIRSVEADTADDMRHLAFGYKIPLRDVSSVPFAKLDPGAVRSDTGSFQWVSVRTKYWLVALMQPVGSKPAGVFRGIVMRGGPRLGKIPNLAEATTAFPLSNGAFAFDLYVGPQSWQELHAMGNDLENVNPYAGWFHAVVQPFATIMMRVLLWMRATLRVNYGWVLVLFGVGIRFLLWPLNQKAMRTSIQMQRLQPELTEIQKRYKNDPEKQREALVRVYADHGMSPFSPMLGCVPMLLPMPVLFALYFVFQNTIEFRGVSFLWLPDISLRDPLYIIPIVMGASMFVLVLDRYAGGAAKSPGEGDELHDAGDVHRHVPQLRVGAKPVLRGAEHRGAAAAVGVDARARSGRREGTPEHEHESRKSLSKDIVQQAPTIGGGGAARRATHASHLHRPRHTPARARRCSDPDGSELRTEARATAAAGVGAGYRAGRICRHSTRCS